jgi:hypothetical protein
MRVGALAIATVLAGCSAEPRVSRFAAPTAGEARAIAVAENFIKVNGYTEAIPRPDGIQPELLEGGLPPSVLWEAHHNTLRPRAYGVSNDCGPRHAGWTVYFERADGRDVLRGVEMSPDLSQVWIAHSPMRLDAPSKVLRARSE